MRKLLGSAAALALGTALLAAAPAQASPAGAAAPTQASPAGAAAVPVTGVTVKNLYNGRCLHDTGVAYGAAAQLRNCDGSSAQRWSFSWVYTPAGGYYELRDSTGVCLDADVQTIGSNGTPVATWNCVSGATNQHWRFEPATNRPDVYRIRVETNQRCLDGAYETINDNGGRVQLWDCYGDSQLNQLWQIG